MDRNKKGQMDLSDRLIIEIGVSVHNSFKKIAKDLERHPSTVSKEIRENRYYIPGTDFLGNDCRKARQCQRKRHLCGNEKCLRTCIACRKWDCREHCDHYVRRHCKRPDEPPYVCNTCSENSVKRHSLGGKCPFELVDDDDKDTKLLMKKLKIHLIPADEVHLTKSLLK